MKAETPGLYLQQRVWRYQRGNTES